MGIWSWPKRGDKKRITRAHSFVAPMFEQLEARILLSVEPTGLNVSMPLTEPDGQVISVDLEYESAGPSQQDQNNTDPSALNSTPAEATSNSVSSEENKQQDGPTSGAGKIQVAQVAPLKHSAITNSYVTVSDSSSATLTVAESPSAAEQLVETLNAPHGPPAGTEEAAPAPGIFEVWYVRGIDYEVPGFSNDDAYNYEIELSGTGITNISLSLPWSQVLESSLLVPENWNGQDPIELEVGALDFELFQEDSLTWFYFGWGWLTDGQWASLDTDAALITVSLANGDTWEATLDFSQVYQTQREPNPITPVHRQVEPGDFSAEWLPWEDAPEDSVILVDIGEESSPWGGGPGWEQEIDLPSSVTSSGPLALPSSLYQLELSFAQIKQSVIDGAVVNTGAFTENDVTFQVGPENSLVVDPLTGDSYFLTPYNTWEECQLYAEQWNGDLVTISSADHEAWLRQHFGTEEPYWLGYNDIAQEGVWEWVSGDQDSYTHWIPGEPNNAGGNEDAALMNSNALGQWNDVPIHSFYHAIVRVPAGVPVTIQDDHGNSPDQATAVLVAETVTGALSYPGDLDVFSFAAGAGQTYEILAELSPEGLEDSTLRLYDVDGQNLLLRDDDGGHGWGSRMVWTAPAQGIYYIVMDAYELWDDGLGEYTVQISESDLLGEASVGMYGQSAEFLLSSRNLGVGISSNYTDATSEEDTILHLLDLTDPLAPTELGEYYGGEIDGAAFDRSGQFCYLGDDSNAWSWQGPGHSELVVLDLSGGADPIEVNRIQIQQVDVDGLTVAGNYLYVGSQPENETEAYLEIYDVSNPSEPVLVGQSEALTSPDAGWYDIDPEQIVIAGARAYVLHDAALVSVLDVTNPTDPVLLGQFDLPNEACWSMAVQDEIMFIASDWQLFIGDVSDPTAPNGLSELDLGGRAGDILIRGERAYVSVGALGAVVVDISDPSDPQIIRTLAGSGSKGNVAMSNGFVYLPTGPSAFIFEGQTGPYVVSTSPEGTVFEPAGTAEFVFDRPMDQTSFSLLDDVLSFTGPGGPLTVTGSGWTDAYTLQLAFTPQTAPGPYELIIGPNIVDQAGIALDQDGDEIIGESEEDRVTLSFDKEPPCDVVLLRGIDYETPGTGLDDEYHYAVQVSGRTVENVEIITPWGEVFNSADHLPSTWPGEESFQIIDNLETETGTEAGLPRIWIGWDLDAQQWLSLDSGLTELSVSFAGATWTGSVGFSAVDQPVQEPTFTNPVHDQSGVELSPALAWQGWNSAPASGEVELRLVDTEGDEDLYEQLLEGNAVQWQVPEVLQPDHRYEVELNFQDRATIPVNGVQANIWAQTETDTEFSTTSFGLGEVWIDRAIDYEVPGHANDDTYNYALDLLGAGITNVVLTTPWGQVVESSQLTPEDWNGRDYVDLQVGAMYFEIWQQGDLTGYELGWDWLNDSQWASLDANPTQVAVGFGNGGTWEASLDFAQVYQTVREPNPITPLHRQAEPGDVVVEWAPWEDAPAQGVAHINLESERPPWGGGVDWDAEYELPASATSSGPITVPDSLYELELAFGDIQHATVNGTRVHTVAYTENDITFLAGPTMPGDDHANNFDQATGVSVAEVTAGELSSQGDLDAFSFTASAGQTYEILVELPPDGLESSTLWLYDTDGRSLLLRDEDGGRGEGSRIVWTAPADGTYYFAVDAEELWDDLGAYTVQVSESDLLGESSITLYEQTTDYILADKARGLRVVSTDTDATSEGNPILHVLDLSDPLAPVELGAYYAGEVEGADFHPSGDYVYLADDSNAWTWWGPGYSEIVVLDVSGGSYPVELNRVRIQQADVDSLAVYGDYLYVGSQPGDEAQAYVEIYDITDPALPISLCQSQELTWPGPEWRAMDPAEILIEGTRAYVLHDGFAVSVLDLSNPTAPELLGQFDLPGEDCWSLAVKDEIMLVDSDWRLFIGDVSDPLAPDELSELDMGGKIGNILIRGERAYVSVVALGMLVVDISDPSDPQIIRTLAGSGSKGNAAMNNGYLYLPTGPAALIFDADMGPHVTQSQPLASILRPLDSISFFFDRPMDQSSFALAQDVHFTGPLGPLVPSAYHWSNAYTLEVSFAEQTALGSYTMTIGPGILDLQGVPLDQNGDGFAGQANDVYVAAINLLAPPDLVLTDIAAASSVALGDQLEVSWTVTNQGNGSAPANWYDALYISDDQTWSPSDTYLYEESIQAQTPLAPGDSYALTRTVSIPSTGVGARYLLIVADASNQQGETDEANNVYALPIVITASDLVVTELTAPDSAAVGESITFSWTVGNQGNAPASADWHDALYISDDTIYDASDQYVTRQYIQAETPLAAGSDYTLTRTVSVPSTALGDRYLLLVTDLWDNQLEGDETNNVYALPITFYAPDLVVTAATAPDVVVLGAPVELSWTVTNQGQVSAPMNWYDALYISDDPLLSSDDTHAHGEWTGDQTPLAPGSSYTRTRTLALPETGTGDRYLLFATDVWQYQGETNEDNNVYALPITLQAADLVLSSASAPASAALGESIPVSWTVENQGNFPAPADWWDGVYVSDDMVYGAGDTYVYTRTIQDQTALAPGDSYTVTQTVTVPNTNPGNRYLLFVADIWHNQGEAHEGNNVYAVPVTLYAADLVVSSASAPASVVLGETVTVEWTVTNEGSHSAPADWVDRVYVSDDTVYGSGDTHVRGVNIGDQTPLAPGASYSITLDVTIPITGLGDRHLLFVADADNRQGETDETNNVYALPITLHAPDLVVSSALAPASAVTGETFTVEWTVTNQGSFPASMDWYDWVRISDDTVFGADDAYVSSLLIQEQTPLSAGASYTVTQTVTLPNTGFGDKHLLFVTDASNHQGETDEGNNVYVVPITLQAPDLVVTSATAPALAALGETVSVSWTVMNQGDVFAPADWADVVYISDDDLFDGSDTYVTSEWVDDLTPLDAGASYTIERELQIPATGTGDRYMLFLADHWDYQGETDETNNLYALPISLSAADLVVSEASAPLSAVLGETVAVSWTALNQGDGEAVADWHDGIYVSDDELLSADDTYVTYHSVADQTPLAAGSGYTIDQSVTIPTTGLGDRYLLFVADAYNHYYWSHRQPEVNENNNVLALPISLSAPDLLVTAATAPATAALNQTVSVSWTVTNQGAVYAPADWYDYVYLSDNATFEDAEDTMLTWQQMSDLASGESYTIVQDIQIPSIDTGDWYLLFLTDVWNAQGETDEGNNAYVAPIRVLAADLVVAEALAPASLVLGETVGVSWTVLNQGEGSAPADWYDSIHLSVDQALSEEDTQVESVWVEDQTPLAAGDSYTIDLDITIPHTGIGSRYILFVADAPYGSSDYQPEVNETNNVLALPTNIVGANLRVSSMVTNTLDYEWGEEIALDWEVQNIGNAPTEGQWQDRVYLSTDVILDGADRIMGTFTAPSIPLGVGEFYTQSQTLSTDPAWNLRAGHYYLLIQTDCDYQVVETEETDNVLDLGPVLFGQHEPGTVDHLIDVAQGWLRYDIWTRRSYVDVTVTNTSAVSLDPPLWLVVTDISHPAVSLVDPDGQTAAGDDYIDLAGELGGASFGPGESISVRLYFNSGFLQSSTFETHVRGIPPVPLDAPDSVDHLLDVTVDRLRYDIWTRQSYTDVHISNNSSTPVAQPLWLAVSDISHAGVTLVNHMGQTESGDRYIDLSDRLSDGQLSPGESISARIFFRGGLFPRFTFTTHVLGSALAPIEVVTPDSVDEWVDISMGSIRRDFWTRQSYMDVTITNTSDFSIDQPVWLVISDLSNPSIVIANSSGHTESGDNYINLTSLMGGMPLAPGELISTRIYFSGFTWRLRLRLSVWGVMI